MEGEGAPVGEARPGLRRGWLYGQIVDVHLQRVLAHVLHELRDLELVVEVLSTHGIGDPHRGHWLHIVWVGDSEICPGFLRTSTTFSATSTVVVSPKAGWPGRSKRSQRPSPFVAA